MPDETSESGRLAHERLEQIRARQAAARAAGDEAQLRADEIANLVSQVHQLRNLLMLYPSRSEVDTAVRRAGAEAVARIEGVAADARQNLEAVQGELEAAKSGLDDRLLRRTWAFWGMAALWLVVGVMAVTGGMFLLNAQRSTDAKFERAVLIACEQRQRLERTLHDILMRAAEQPRQDESPTEQAQRADETRRIAEAMLSPPCGVLLDEPD